MKTQIKLVWLVLLLGLTALAQAKEITLILKAQTSYPMKIHYKFSSTGNVYGQGKMLIEPKAETQYIAVNRIPDNETVLVQVNKMTVGNWTEINDPCEISLGKTDLTANITIGFKGNPSTHGSFTCFVTKS